MYKYTYKQTFINAMLLISDPLTHHIYLYPLADTDDATISFTSECLTYHAL